MQKTYIIFRPVFVFRISQTHPNDNNTSPTLTTGIMIQAETVSGLIFLL